MADTERDQGAGAAADDAAAVVNESAAPETAPAEPSGEPSGDTGDAGASGAEASADAAPEAAEPAAEPAAAPSEPAPAAEAAAPSAPAAAPAAGAPAEPGFLDLVRSFFWLDQRLAAARRDGFVSGKPGHAEFELARDGLVCAQRLSELSESKTGVLLLHREVASLLIAAQVARAGLTSDATPVARWAALADHAIGKAAVAGIADADRELFVAALAPDGAASVAALPAERRAALASVLSKVVERLAESLEREAQRISSILYQRWLRIAAALLVLFGVIGAGIYVVKSSQPEVNLARGKTVHVSSNSKRYGCDPQQFVDGNRGGLGFHTNKEKEPWVEVDLGSVEEVKRVVVYNRETNPGRAVPLVLELATEPGQYHEVARRDEVFDVWSVDVPPEDARYVRLKLLKKEFLHLAEIEVY